jgi:hypothetical protein
MSRRTIFSLASSVIVGIACIAMISLMRSHIAVGALALAALAFITQASIAAVFTVARPYAVEWR